MLRIFFTVVENEISRRLCRAKQCLDDGPGDTFHNRYDDRVSELTISLCIGDRDLVRVRISHQTCALPWC